MGARKINNLWYADFRFNRERYRKRSPENSRVGALAYEALLRQKLTRGESLIEVVKTEIPTFESFSSQWFKMYVMTNNKFSEQRYKRSVLRKHLVPLFGKLPLDQISPIKIEEFKVLGLKNGLAPKSVNNCLSILRKSLNDAREWEIILNVPKMKFLKVPPSKFDFLSEDECKKLLGAITDTFWYSMVLTAMKTGLRLSELIGLRWEDISLSRGMLSVKRGIVRGVIGSPKSNKDRHVPLTQELCEVLHQRAKKEGWVFSVRNDNPLDHKTPSDALTRFCRRAGLRCIGWHKLRHTFASHLAMKGVPLKAVQELLGHSDIQTTMRYAHLSPSALRDAISVLEPKKHESEIFGQQLGKEEKFSPDRSLESLFSSDEFALHEKQKRGI